MTRYEIGKIVSAAKELAWAHERRNPTFDTTTLRERQALADLERAIEDAQDRAI